MTVPATSRRAGPYNGNGSTTSFSFSFKTFAAGDLQVTKTGTTGLESVLVLNSDYSVTLNGDQDASPGGSITYPISGTALASGEKLTIVGDLDYEQTTDLLGGGAFNARTIEDTFDRTVIQIQQLEERADRALTLPVSATASTVLPVPAAGKVIAWDSSASALVNVDSADLASVVVAGTSYTDIFNGTGAQTAFTLTANPGSVNALDIAIGGVSQVNGVDFTVSGTTLTFTSAPPVGTGNVVVRYVAALPVGTTNAQDVVFNPAGTGASSRTVQSKLRDVASIRDFGAVGDGVADDTAAIQAALNAARHVEVPAGMTCLISSTITVPSQTRLSFLGGDGNLSSAMPASYFIKKSTMTTVGISISQRGVVDGGGLLGQVGNTGDGVQLANNAAVLRNFIVAKAGRDGVRVGTDGVFANCNSTVIEYVKSRENGRHGFYVHDGVSVETADANAGTLLQCTAISNGADGIRLGHAFWVSIINCLTEINTGWGLYLSGANNASYPECRWATVLGGDFNEGNVTGQVYDGSYFATFIQPDITSVPTTAATGLQGGGYRSVISASGGSTLQGLEVDTSVAGPASRPLRVFGGYSGGNLYPVSIRQRTTASNGEGPGLLFEVDPNTGTYRNAAQIAVLQRTTNVDQLVFYTHNAGSMTAMLVLNPFEVRVTPGADNTTKLGDASLRWSTVFAATGTINTSDEREKQDIADLSAAERRVAVALKGLVKKFRFKDAVQAKGDAARIHVGVIAQEVIAAFQAEGLDAARYGLLCHDEWDAEDGRPAGDRYGVRYEELLAFIIAAL